MKKWWVWLLLVQKILLSAEGDFQSDRGDQFAKELHVEEGYMQQQDETERQDAQREEELARQHVLQEHSHKDLTSSAIFHNRDIEINKPSMVDVHLFDLDKRSDVLDSEEVEEKVEKNDEAAVNSANNLEDMLEQDFESPKSGDTFEAIVADAADELRHTLGFALRDDLARDQMKQVMDMAHAIARELRESMGKVFDERLYKKVMKKFAKSVTKAILRAHGSGERMRVKLVKQIMKDELASSKKAMLMEMRRELEVKYGHKNLK